MARPAPQTLAKRQREQKKREKKLAKKEKMALRKAQKELDAADPSVSSVETFELLDAPRSAEAIDADLET